MLALLFLAPVALAGPSALFLAFENKLPKSTLAAFLRKVLQTQFWDTWAGFEKDGQLLPKQTSSIHGLWPHNCDGSFESYCDLTRQYDPKPKYVLSSSRQIKGETVPVYTGPGIDTFIKFGRHDLVDNMNKFCVAQGQPIPDFWAHEFALMTSALGDPSLPSFEAHDMLYDHEVVNFFDTVVRAYKQYPTYRFLAAKGIVPSNTTPYTLSAVLGALEPATGATPHVDCSPSGALNEVWYYSHSFGAPQLGVLKHLNTTFGATCPETGTPGTEW
ncbi:ribonuclease T2 [Exidia glandulosa HHB12029]|uniref:Ribonuclease T2 n=1 Tax=Exidia glandulosa HHB12029 TaxID=1314781 RepID=A0A166N336_EXIGL|nr:ribonuclease T2 [Exidia glandulosa HHB12029]